MNFKNKKEKENYFDDLLDLFKKYDYDSFEVGVMTLQQNIKKDLLIYVFSNKEILDTDNNDILFRILVDCF
jgi:uncharacterized protein (DUF927 family)